MADPIKFGTDGWRAVIADDFTYTNVRRVARAIAAYVRRYEDTSRGVLIGYDTRYGSRRFAQLVAESIAADGIAVRLASATTPTPAVSYMVRKLGAACGVVITSSHNSWEWNGIKLKANYGGSATPAIVAKLQALIDSPGDAVACTKAAQVSEMDMVSEYLGAIRSFADLELIARAKPKFAIDPMYGAGCGILAGIFTELGVPFVEVHGNPDPLFPGINPEPILPHLSDLQHAVVEHHCDAGLATDGDADRIGAVDENGNVVDAHKCFAVLLEWLLKRKQWPGAVTRAFNTTRMLDRIARAHGRGLIEHGIGFKYVVEQVVSGREVLIGGEESGGIGIPRFLPERDGLLNALLIANAMAEEGKTLGQLVEDLQQRYGPHHYGRRDLHLDEQTKQSALARAAAGPEKIGSFRVLRIETLDGFKFFLDAPTFGNGAEAWVLVRGSGTEPLLRVYCEAASPELVEEILAATAAMVQQGCTLPASCSGANSSLLSR